MSEITETTKTVYTFDGVEYLDKKSATNAKIEGQLLAALNDSGYFYYGRLIIDDVEDFMNFLDDAKLAIMQYYKDYS